MDEYSSLHILILIHSLSSKSPNYPAGLGSYPCSKRQVNIASDLTLALSTPLTTPGVNLLCVMGSCDKMHPPSWGCDIIPWGPLPLSNRKR